MEQESVELPRIINGGVFTDERGTVRFANDFSLRAADRFYVISPAQPRTPRGWVAHRRDHKWFSVVRGKFAILVAPIEAIETAACARHVARYVLADDRGDVLDVPPGFGTVVAALAADSHLLVFSSGIIANAASDQYRFAFDAALGDLLFACGS